MFRLYAGGRAGRANPGGVAHCQGSAVCPGFYHQLTRPVCCCTALCVYRIGCAQAAVLASISVVLLSTRESAVCTGLYRQLTKSLCCCTALCVYGIGCAQAAVLASIPVVFFTAKGIPGEVEERVDTPAGLVAASMRAMGLGGWSWCTCECVMPI
jgi:hypothetical protein